MRYIKTALLLCLALSFIVSCKKDKYTGPQGPEGPAGPTGTASSPDPALFTKWTVVSGLSETRYIIFKNDFSINLLDSAQYGFKTISSDLAFITDKQLYYDYSAYNYVVINDTLKITNQTDTVVLKKNTNAPDMTTWVTYLNVIDSINNPVVGGEGHQDIGFDGNYILWSGSWNSSKIYRINPETGSHTSLNLSGNYYNAGVTCVAPSIWIADISTFDQIDPSNGSVLNTSPVISSEGIRALAISGGGSMVYCTPTGKVFSFDMVSHFNMWLFTYPGDFTGMEYVNGFLYFFGGHYLFKWQVSSFGVVSSYYIDSPLFDNETGGITYDGTHFWVVGKNPNTDEYKLLKLNL